MLGLCISLAVIVGCALIIIKLQRDEKKEVDFKLSEAYTTIAEEVEKNRVILSQKKSSETRLGQTTEHLVPFLDGFPYDPKDCHFLGMPIDYIVFDFDEGKIVFVEVKTGNARESDRQKKIKNMIKTGRVYYNRVRVNEKGVKLSEEKNND